MIIKTIPRDRRDHFVCTIFKEDRKRLVNFSEGDIVIVKIDGKLLIRKVKEDFIISLPKILAIKPNKEAKIELLRHVKPEEGLKRPRKYSADGKISTRYFIPLKTAFGHKIFVIDNGEKIFVWFPVGGGVEPICIKKFVNPKSLFETIGFLWGDGSTENVRSLRFTNSEPSTLDFTINFFGSMGIKRKMWKAQIIWSGPSEPSKEIKKECKKFWSREILIPKENIKSVLWSKCKANRTKFGSCRIFIDNAILFEIFVNGILKWCKDRIKDENLEKEILQPLVRGVLASEGSIDFRRGVIQRISIAFDPYSNEEILFRKMFKCLGISTLPNHKNAFSIDGWDNFLRLFLIDSFILDKNSNEKFCSGFIHHKSTSFRYKMLNDIKHGKQIRGRTLERLIRSNLIKKCDGIILTDLGESFTSKLTSF